tara:strand:- start:287 stop:481 length:195 start_codon:yes stop_codon:yes gene_type:complete
MSKIWKCKHCKEQFKPAQVIDPKYVAYSYTAKGLDQVVLKTQGITEVMCAECNIFHSKEKRKAS